MFLQTHPNWLWGVAIASGLTFVASLVALPVLIARLPDDYYIRRPVAAPLSGLGWLRKAVLNVVGCLLVLAGLAMLVLPGQGILTIVIGLACMDFPGKRRLERRIVSNPKVLAAANWIRARAQRAPLRVE
ncbi:MAG: PGPGW domain-containing protein [Gammaproteobacteria bacterium]|nr:PGPGW domain-containing protein [Gammaproteobacteria bacterium]